MAKHLRTVEQVIHWLGGNRAVAKLTRRGTSTGMVSNWKTRGFPPETFIVLKRELQARGATAPDKLWGMS